MLIFLPERIYEKIKGEPAYIELVNDVEHYADKTATSMCEYAEKLYYTSKEGKALYDKYLFVMNGLLADTPLFKQEFYTLNNQAMAETLFLECTEPHENMENTLFIYYYIISNTYRIERNEAKTIEYINTYISYVDEYASTRFSERIYVKYLQYKWYLARKKLFERIRKKHLRLSVAYDEFINEVYAIRDAQIERFGFTSTDDYVQNIIGHKIVDEIKNFMTDISSVFAEQQGLAETRLTFDKVIQTVAAVNFKYKDFTYALVVIYDGMFNTILNLRDFDRAARLLRDIIELINHSFNDVPTALAALTHHNFVFIENYLGTLMNYGMLLNMYLTECKYKINMDVINDKDAPFVLGQDIPNSYGFSANIIDCYNNHLKRFDLIFETLEIFNSYLGVADY